MEPGQSNPRRLVGETLKLYENKPQSQFSHVLCLIDWTLSAEPITTVFVTFVRINATPTRAVTLTPSSLIPSDSKSSHTLPGMV